jgi:stearoyl-CoA desaturase (delta-9 desaturase)
MNEEQSDGGAIRRFHRDRILWSRFWGIAVLHLLCLLAPFQFSWSALGVAVLLSWAACGLGISMGYHRLLTHRGFETSKVFHRLLAILGTLNYQGGPIDWVGIHRTHHRDADTDHDPHSPEHGFLWAHVLWCVCRDPLGRDTSEAAKDLKKDRFHVLLNRWSFAPQVVLAVVLWALGGWSWVIWGVAVRTIFTYHTTWLVNSASHTWGYRNFATKDGSKNTWWVALLSWGEGWHNNHHAHPRSARHGLRRFEIDATWWTLRVLEKLGVVWNLYAVRWNSPVPAVTEAGR